ncbi:hypothetical protein EDC04DRAFT_2734505 [Pisolithus marmoratus]|nr:hypothetical protein EDC04DRAFT_2734505 [Pisolithus marmoratus]
MRSRWHGHGLAGSVLDVVVAFYNVTCGTELVNPIIHDTHILRGIESYSEIHVHCSGHRSITGIVTRPTNAVKDTCRSCAAALQIIHFVAGGGRPITRWRSDMNRARTCPLLRDHTDSVDVIWLLRIESASRLVGY